MKFFDPAILWPPPPAIRWNLSLPNPDLAPFVTSYFEGNWGEAPLNRAFPSRDQLHRVQSPKARCSRGKQCASKFLLRAREKIVSFRGWKSGWRRGNNVSGAAGRAVSKRAACFSLAKGLRQTKKQRSYRRGTKKPGLTWEPRVYRTCSRRPSVAAPSFRRTARRTIQSTADCKNKRDDALFSSAHFDLRRGPRGSFYFRRPREADFQNARRGRCTTLSDSAAFGTPVADRQVH